MLLKEIVRLMKLSTSLGGGTATEGTLKLLLDAFITDSDAGSTVIWHITELYDIDDYSDDDISNITPKPALLVVLDPEATGSVKVLLSGESAPRVVDIRLAVYTNLLIRKVYATGTDSGLIELLQIGV